MKRMCLQFPETPEKLTAAEKAILEYIEGHKETFLFMTIGELAQTLNVSDATISRLPGTWAAGTSSISSEW